MLMLKLRPDSEISSIFESNGSSLKKLPAPSFPSCFLKLLTDAGRANYIADPSLVDSSPKLIPIALIGLSSSSLLPLPTEPAMLLFFFFRCASLFIRLSF